MVTSQTHGLEVIHDLQGVALVEANTSPTEDAPKPRFEGQSLRLGPMAGPCARRCEAVVGRTATRQPL